MKKTYITIIGGGLLVTVLLISIWLISFLDTKEEKLPEETLLINTTSLSVDTNNEAITEEKTEPKKEYDLTQIRSNGQVIEIPAGVDLSTIPEEEKSLLRSDSSGSGTPEGWINSDWPNEIPTFDTGTVKSVLKSIESEAWMMLIASTKQSDIDKYAKKLNNSGWETSNLEENEDGFYGINAKKGDWEAIIIYNPEVSETMVSATKGTEIQN